MSILVSNMPYYSIPIQDRTPVRIIFITSILVLFLFNLLVHRPVAGGDSELMANTYVEMVDWHISGLMIINCPVAWIRISNHNTIGIKNLVVRYTTYDENGHPLNNGLYRIKETIGPGEVKNMTGEYLGLVDLYSEKLSIQLVGEEPDI